MAAQDPWVDQQEIARLAAIGQMHDMRVTHVTSTPPPLANHQLVNASSGETDIHSPVEVLDPVRTTFGGPIALDPASSATANERVKAETYWTEPSYTVVGRMEHDGAPIRHYVDWGALSRPWDAANVFLNPPFGTPDSACKPLCTKVKCRKRGWHTYAALPGMSHWVDYFIGEYKCGHLDEGIIITFASTSEGWFQPLMPYPVCFPRKRTNYLLPDGMVYKGVTKGSALTYVGPNARRFAEVFSALGTVKVDVAQL